MPKKLKKSVVDSSLPEFANTVIQGDSSEVMKRFPDDCIDLTVSSPPYDNIRIYHGYNFEPEKIIDQLYRVTKPGGVVVWIMMDAVIAGSESGSSFRQALYFKQVGFSLHDTMIWHKPFTRPNENDRRYTSSFEYMFVFCKDSQPKTFNPLLIPSITAGKSMTTVGFRKFDGSYVHEKRRATLKVRPYKRLLNVWTIRQEIKKNPHPAAFPRKLAEMHIRTWSNEGDLILDPMCGSGTSLMIARYLKRNFVGIDVSNEYCEVSRAAVESVNA